MKTFNSWCAANVGLIGLVLALLIIGMTCLFRMEELRYLEFVPLLLWPMSFFFIWPGKTISDVLVRLLLLFGSIAFICYFPRFGDVVLLPETKTKLKALMVIMLLVGLVFASFVTIYVWRNFFRGYIKKNAIQKQPC